jgi:hypothetical protein
MSYGFPPIEILKDEKEQHSKKSGTKEKFFSNVMPQTNNMKMLLIAPKEKLIKTEKIIDELDVIDNM